MAEPAAPRRVRLLVCGERLRGDDGAAAIAAERLPADARALADVLEVGQLEIEGLLDVPEGVAVVVADAAVGIGPGEIVTLPLEAVATGFATAAPASSHALPPDQVLALAREVRGSLPLGSFVGIGGLEFGFGEPLSPAVAAAMPAFVEALASEVRRLAKETAGSPEPS